MTTPRRRGLQIDDPLASSQPPAGDTPSGRRAEHPSSDATRQQPPQASTGASPVRRPQKTANTSSPTSGGEREPPADPAAGHGENGVWREWSGITGVGSFRLPHELLVELGDAARKLELPIGMIVTAAITQLLDEPADQIAALVDRADDARIHARRTARRRLSEIER